jgi:hypothetical protein
VDEDFAAAFHFSFPLDDVSDTDHTEVTELYSEKKRRLSDPARLDQDGSGAPPRNLSPSKMDVKRSATPNPSERSHRKVSAPYSFHCFLSFLFSFPLRVFGNISSFAV